MTDRYDAIVVGAGPNGLSAAIVLAQAGRSVLVREAHETVGGGCRSAELTLPGVVHDVCSAVHHAHQNLIVRWRGCGPVLHAQRRMRFIEDSGSHGASSHLSLFQLVSTSLGLARCGWLQLRAALTAEGEVRRERARSA